MSYKKLIFLFIIIILFIICGHISFAANLKDAFPKNSDNGPVEYSPLEKTVEDAGYDIFKSNIDPIVGTVIQSALSFLGVIFLILMIYGGYLWMTAQGNEEQVTKAKNLITAAMIGIVIVVSAYAISYFVISKVTKGALSS